MKGSKGFPLPSGVKDIIIKWEKNIKRDTNQNLEMIGDGSREQRAKGDVHEQQKKNICRRNALKGSKLKISDHAVSASLHGNISNKNEKFMTKGKCRLNISVLEKNPQELHP